MEQINELQSPSKSTAFHTFLALRSLIEEHSVTSKDTFITLNKYYDIIIQNKPYNAYHYKLLRIMLRQFQYPTREKLEKLVVLLNIELSGVKSHTSLYLQNEYLRLVQSVVKCGPHRLSLIIPHILEWVRYNQNSVIEKHLLNIVRDLDIVRYTNLCTENKSHDTQQPTTARLEKYCFDLIHMFDYKGYFNVLLPDGTDYFISKTNIVSQQHQSKVIEIVLIVTDVLVEKDLINETLIEEYISSFSQQHEIISCYIFSVLRDSDTALFKCLMLMMRIYERIIMMNIPCVVNIIESRCFSPLTWFMKLVEHIKFDHTVLLDWLLDGESVENVYIMNILSFIDKNYSEFMESCHTCNEQTVSFCPECADRYMSVLIRLNLSLDGTSPLCLLLDNIELQYEECSVDPLDGVLCEGMSYMTFDDKSVEMFTKKCLVDYSVGLVAYSDNESDSGA